MTKKITAGLIIAITAIAIIYDIVIVIEPTQGDTISEVILSFAYRHPFLPLAMGVLIGHLTWPRKYSDKKRIYFIIALAITGASVLVIDVLKVIPPIKPVIAVIPGIILGHFLWPQKPRTETPQE